MFRNYAVTDAKPQPGTLPHLFSCEEGIEEVLQIVRVNSRAITIDTERNEVVIGVRVMMVNTGTAKQALEQAGFKIGGAMLSPL